MKRQPAIIGIVVIVMLIMNCGDAIAQSAFQSDSVRLNSVPAKNLLLVTYITPTEGKVVFQLVDAAGKIYQAKEAGLSAGKNLISLNIAGIEPGSYLLRIIRGKSIRAMKLVIGASAGSKSFFNRSKNYRYGSFRCFSAG